MKIDFYPPIKLILYSFAFLELFIVIPYAIVVIYYDINPGGIDLGNKSIFTILFIAIILSPLLETLVFQTLIINIIKKISPKLTVLAVVVSGFLFGLSHSYSNIYILYTTLIGLVLAYVYILAQKKKFNPFLIVFSIHALHNLAALFFIFF